MSDYEEKNSSVEEQGTGTENAGQAEPSGQDYRRAPYMREGSTYSSQSESEAGSGRKYAYDDDARYRTRYTDGGNGPKKGGGWKIVAAVVAAALILGGIVGVACWRLGANVSVASSRSGAVIETMAPENKQAPAPTEQAAAQAESESEQTVAAETEETTAAETASAAVTTVSQTEPATTAGVAGVMAETQTAEVQTEETQQPEASAEAQVAMAGENSQIETAAADENAPTVKALDVTEVVEVAMPSVVSITTTAVYESYNNNTFDPFYYYFYGGYGGYGNQGGSNTYQQVTGAGSGIILGDDGEELWIVTNNHVVKDAESLNVSFSDGTTSDAYVKGTDAHNDLAVVGVKLADLSDDTKKAIRAVKMGDSDSLKLGETVIAIGNALGLGQSVSTGVVSALNREITTSEGTKLTTIQTDAAINPGNSGGALLDAAGELIGINVAKDAETDVEGMGYAIPISKVKDIISQLTVTREAVSEDQYPYMGVQLQDINSEVASVYRLPEGILVYSIEEDSPARAAGMLEQDIITAFNGRAVSTYEELTEELKYYAGGTTVTVTVKRLENGAYEEKELTMTLGLRKDHQSQSSQQNEQNQQNQQGQQDQQQAPGQNGQQQGGQQGGFPFGQ